MAMAYLQLVLLVLTAGTHTAYSIKCMECLDMPDPQDCTFTTECSAYETCHVTQFITSGGLLLYNSGCMAKTRCPTTKREVPGALVRRQELVSTTDIVTCVSCCDTEYCNLEGCGITGLRQPQRGPVCFSCNAQSDPSICRDVQTCSDTQVCSLSQHFIGSQIVYTSKCDEKRRCEAFAAIGKRGIHDRSICFKCCTDDFCNDDCGPSAHLTTALPSPTPPVTRPITSTQRPTVTSKPTQATTHTPKPTQATTHTPKPTQATTHTPKPTQATTHTPKPTHAPHTPRPTHATHTPKPTHATTHTPKPTQATTHTPKPTQATTHTPKPTQATTHTPKPTHAPHTPRPTHATTHTPKPTQATTHTPKPTHAPHTPRPTHATTHTPKPTQATTHTPKPTQATTQTPKPTVPSTVQTTTTLPTTTKDPEISCKKDNYIFDSHLNLCLKFHTTPKLNWTDALHACELDNGTLAVITSPSKAKDVQNFISSHSQHAGVAYWVGANDKTQAHVFTWLNGETIVFQGNNTVDMTQANCLFIDGPTTADLKYESCTQLHAYICEKKNQIRTRSVWFEPV